MRGEEWLTVLLEVFLAGLDEAIEPRQPSLLAVVGVENHWHTVELGHLTGINVDMGTACQECSPSSPTQMVFSKPSAPVARATHPPRCRRCRRRRRCCRRPCRRGIGRRPWRRSPSQGHRPSKGSVQCFGNCRIFENV